MVLLQIYKCLTIASRELDKKAQIQREKETAAEAKIQAAKSGARNPDRTAPIRTEPTRADSSERPSGPPRLALAGSKPTWRERQAQKEAGAVGGAPAAASPADIATEEVNLPKKTGGYVPPSRRGGDAPPAPRGRPDAATSSAPRDASSSVEPTTKRRDGLRQDGLGRDGSPADGPRPRFLDGLRGPTAGRDQSPSDGGRPVSSGMNRTESPAGEAPPSKPAPGKYVPVHLRNK